MSGPTPVLSTHRIQFPYTVDGLPHKVHFYVNAYEVASVWKLTNIGGFSDPGFHAAVDQIEELLAPAFQVTISEFGTSILQVLDDGAYFPVATYSGGGAPTSTDPYTKAGQATSTFYAEDFSQVDFMLLETTETFFGHVTNIPDLSSTFEDITNNIITPTAAAHLGNWMRSRSSDGIQSFIGWTLGLNRKARRNRGMV